MSTISDADSKVLTSVIPVNWNLADLKNRIGEIPPERIRLSPPLGCATEDDVLRVEEEEGLYCELELGVLVEKPMGWYESVLAAIIIGKLNQYLEANPLGLVTGEGGQLKILPGVIKIPDAAFISWSRFPKEKVPRRPIPAIIPDLAVEVLSGTNTRSEMARKLERYFESGVRLVWYVDPPSRTASVYTSPTAMATIAKDGCLDGGDILPGFRLSLEELFQRADQRPE